MRTVDVLRHGFRRERLFFFRQRLTALLNLVACFDVSPVRDAGRRSYSRGRKETHNGGVDALSPRAVFVSLNTDSRIDSNAGLAR